MRDTWDLSIFYTGFDDPAFARDLAALPQEIAAYRAAIDAPQEDAAIRLRTLLAERDALEARFERLSSFVQLTLACDATNEAANAAMTPLMAAAVAYAQADNALTRAVAAIPNLDAVLEGDGALRDCAFAIAERAENAAHLLPQEVEGPVLRMQLSGGEAFSQLRDKLDATLLVDYRGERLPLSAVRAKANDPDAAVRREAYEAELAAYKKIDLPMSYCLNSIKAEARTVAELRGFSGVLEMTLADSRMDAGTLEAMWAAIREALPELRVYFKAKAKLLGHDGALPFYDLFAPVGESHRTYTLEQARDLLLRVFGDFCPPMREMMDEAFQNGWIDAYPRAGKSGGAFCAGAYQFDQSRILANFAGSMEDVSTLAHELGHAFNNRMLRRVPRAMTETPMPLAETASTFNEVLLSAELRRGASAQEELHLLDAGLTECMQTMVDIYSRFLFEQKVVEAQADHAPSVGELCETMLWAQEQTYGDGLAPDARHPYMWACKSHYYSTGAHFYNFPYAFGNLFARGLYARYAREGKAFVPIYCDLLSRFGSGRIADVTASVGIDVTTPAFWREAVESVLTEVRRFEQLVEERK